MRNDPFPGKEMLTRAEVGRLIGVRGRTALKEFLDNEPGFPKAIAIGTTGKKKLPRLRFKKSKVLAWIDLQGND